MNGMETKRKKIAIVTGASAGLGVEFAKQISATEGLDEVWLVARREDRLRALAESLGSTKAIPLALDLAAPGAIEDLALRLTKEHPDLRLLVNNAGMGKIGAFNEIPLAEQLAMIDLNVRALTELTYRTLPFMSHGSRILQVASSIGFCPAPYFSVYAATKAYVVSFSDALQFELAHKGIAVTAVCPGPVATEFFDVAKPKSDPSAAPFNQALMASAEEVVRKSLEDSRRGKRHSIYSWPIRSFVALSPFVPRSIMMKALALRK
jgi:uncharacterized protein